MTEKYILRIPENPNKILCRHVFHYMQFDGKVLPKNILTCIREEGLEDWLEEIPAEPKVLTAEECETKYWIIPGVLDIEGYWKRGYKTGFGDGDKNGQLREWLRPEQVELRSLVERYIDRGNGFMQEMFEEVLKNLKPLNE